MMGLRFFFYLVRAVRETPLVTPSTPGDEEMVKGPEGSPTPRTASLRSTGPDPGVPGGTFQPGRIHERKAFWETLHASDWVMRVLQFGYYIPFESQPSAYSEKNNKSARDEPVFVEQQIKDWLQLGVLVPFPEAVCINPLSVAFKTEGDKVGVRDVRRFC